MSGVPRIPVVDDEPEVREMLVRLLEGEGYELTTAADGASALRVAESFRPDVTLLDVTLPGGPDGLEVARLVRDRFPTAIIFVRDPQELLARICHQAAGQIHRTPQVVLRRSLSGAGAEEDVVAGLASGGDDYVVKPFRAQELRARVAAVLRRSASGSSQVWRLGDLLVDEGAHRVTVAGAEVALTAKEYAMLRLLVCRRARVVTKREILDEVWGWAEGGDYLVQVHMSKLRHKLGEAGSELIQTVRGVGYVLQA